MESLYPPDPLLKNVTFFKPFFCQKLVGFSTNPIKGLFELKLLY